MNWLLYLTVGVMAVVLVGASREVVRELRAAMYARMARELHGHARLIEAQLPRALESEVPDLQERCRRWAEQCQAQVTIISAEGKVLADSEADPAEMDNHADWPEFHEALAGREGTSIRQSQTIGERMVYAAVPVKFRGQTVGAVRVGSSVRGIDEALRAVRNRIITGGVGMVVVAAAAAYLATRRAVRPWLQVQQAAERFSAGDLEYRLPAYDLDEARPLAEALNRMAAQLADRLQVLTQQRNQHEALLGSMVEGVLAVDAEEQVIVINRAAAELFGVDPIQARGQLLGAVIRNVSVQRFVAEVLSKGEPQEDEIVVNGSQERFLRVHGTALRDSQGRRIGALVVFGDVTRLRRLEVLRRDFVANASHELRTPITSIKGFVETLRDGALDSREDAERFLAIIARQSERLEAIVDDMLALSRLEEETERRGISVAEEPLCNILEAAVQEFEIAAEDKGIEIKLSCEPGLRAHVNRELIEQAVGNLIDNAIKHGNADSVVSVIGEETEDEIVIRVRDQGPGIEPEHLPRLFERFYRVDRGRSRRLGGTGLGLAIVKHIAQAHHGRVGVESVHGQGSTFSIYLPRRSFAPAGVSAATA